MSVGRTLQLDQSALGGVTRGPLPASQKLFARGALHPFLRVPMRQIAQTPTRLGYGANERMLPNPQLVVYDASGPYTDPTASIDVRKGLAPIRSEWVRSRGDVQELPQVSSEYGRLRLADARLNAVRFENRRKPLVARSGSVVTQLHYARRGMITPEMEFVAIR